MSLHPVDEPRLSCHTRTRRQGLGVRAPPRNAIYFHAGTCPRTAFPCTAPHTPYRYGKGCPRGAETKDPNGKSHKLLQPAISSPAFGRRNRPRPLHRGPRMRLLRELHVRDQTRMLVLLQRAARAAQAVAVPARPEARRHPFEPHRAEPAAVALAGVLDVQLP